MSDFNDWRHAVTKCVSINDTGSSNIRKLIIKVLDDTHGINKEAFNVLRTLADKDILEKVETLDNRFFLPEKHGLA